MGHRILSSLLLIGFLSVCPAFAEDTPAANATLRNSTGTSSTSPLGYEEWGVRIGATDDADQVIGGVQFNFGEVARGLRLQPDLELGAGDDATTLYGTVPLYYRFRAGARTVPYAGGGLALGWVDRDLPPGSSGDESSFEMGARATGGLEWARPKGEFFVELSLGFGDVHDVRAVAAWMF